MQTELSTHTQVQENDRLLRRALQANAIFSTICAALLVWAARPLGEWMGLPPTALRVLGLGFIPFILFLFYMTRQPTINPAHARFILILDAAWVVLTPVLLLSGWLPLTATGKWIIILTTDIVAILAVLEYVGLRRYRAS